MKVLITGLTGFVGPYVAAEVARRDSSAEIFGLVWAPPDEETARRVERYANNGGGYAYARRRAVRSYKFDEASGRWKTLNIKTSKKWKQQAAEKTKKRRQKKTKQVLVQEQFLVLPTLQMKILVP